MTAKIPANVREQQINALPNITFVRWEGEYRSARSKAVCRCAIDGFEWSTAVDKLCNERTGCPKCAGIRRTPEKERIAQINALPNIKFIRWDVGYRNNKSKAVCRCEVDGREWVASVTSLIDKGTGCPQCAGNIHLAEEERVEQINELPNIIFLRWHNEYRNWASKAVCRCAIDGYEWVATTNSLLSSGTGCPKCAASGYSRAKPSTLYALRSGCGAMVKIGISNNYMKRHAILKRSTPFSWSCIGLIHSDDGAFIAKAEKELHSLTEQAQFSEPFDGYTEWRKWDARIPEWFRAVSA